MRSKDGISTVVVVDKWFRGLNEKRDTIKIESPWFSDGSNFRPSVVTKEGVR